MAPPARKGRVPLPRQLLFRDSMPLIVLDRDGVINADSADFVRSVDAFQPLPGSIEALAGLSRQGITVAVATNQSGLGRGLFTDADLAAMHARLRDSVESLGGRIDAIAWCPHHPDDGCPCRKPRAGLLHALAAALGQPMDGAPMVGDSLRDLEAGIAVGARPVLVRSGKGAAVEADARALGASVFDDLAAVARAVLDGSLPLGQGTP